MRARRCATTFLFERLRNCMALQYWRVADVRLSGDFELSKNAWRSNTE